MDWQSGLAGDHGLYTQHVIPAADFLVAHGPSDGVERWEEQSGYSPSTIAAEIAGLTAAAHIARVNHDPARAAVYQATADDFARNIKAWTVTTNGPFISSTVPSYFLRITKNADPNSGDQVDLGNGSITVDQRSLIDAGFLELVRLGILPADDPTIQSSLTVVDNTIERQTPSGPGFYRYGTSSTESVDGYGDCYQPSATSCTTIGAPWAADRCRHRPPVARALRRARRVRPRRRPALIGDHAADVDAQHDLRPGPRARAGVGGPGGAGLALRQPTRRRPRSASSPGSPPAPPARSPGPRPSTRGWPSTSAPGARSRRRGSSPTATSRHGMPGSLPLTISSPASGTSVNSSTVTVSGHELAGRADRRRGCRCHRRHGRHGLDDGRQLGQLVAAAAGRLRLDDDHRHRDLGPQHRLCPDARDQRRAAGHAGAQRHRPRPATTTARAPTSTRPPRTSRRAALTSPG